MSYKKLSEIIKSTSEFDKEELTAKLGYCYQEMEDKNEVENFIAGKILEDCDIILPVYSKDTLAYLYDICKSKLQNKEDIEFDVDFNTLVCDGLCFVENNVIKTTEDFALVFVKCYEEGQDDIAFYDELEKVIDGIIKANGIISTDDLFEIFKVVKTDKEKKYEDISEFEFFLFHRDSLLAKYVPYQADLDNNEYLFIEEIEEVELLLEELEKRSLKVLSRDKYIQLAKGNNFATNEKLLSDFKLYLLSITDDNEDETNDIITNVMIDIKTGNLDDLMLDVMTYVEIGTEEDHEKIKHYLSELYKATPSWK